MAKRSSSVPGDAFAKDTAKPANVVSLAGATPAEKGNETASFVLRQKDLAAAVAARCEGVKKLDLKRVMEATLAELGAALGRGQSINLSGLGKARVVKTVERKGGAVLTMKLQTVSDKKTDAAPLAEDKD